jgi:hypothetical protein
MDITITQLIILALASFRLTRLFIYDKIFEGVRAPFFTEIEEDGDVYLVPKGKIGELLSCHWCTGFWCSVLVGISYWLFDINISILVFAVAGLSSLLQLLTQHD